MYRIYDELRLGRYYLRRWLGIERGYEYVSDRKYATSDVLILSHADVKQLNEEFLNLKAKGEDSYYTDMLEAICRFVDRYSEQAEFILEGEL